MGRIVELCSEVAAAADEGPEGLVLSTEARARLRDEWPEEDIDDALSFVRDSLLQGELVDAADSLSTGIIDLLGAFGTAAAFARLQTGEARLTTETIDRLARRVSRLEEILGTYRDSERPAHRGFEALRTRLLDLSIEGDMWGGSDDEADEPRDEEEDH